MRIRRVTATLFLLAAAAAQGQVELHLHAGFRSGGELEDALTRRPVTAEASESFGLALDIPLKGLGRYIEVYWSRQETELELPGFLPGTVNVVDLTIDYLHAGGVYRWGEGRLRPYVLATVGATLVDAGEAEAYPSLSLGVGLRYKLSERLALRFDARGFATFESGSAAIFCGGGCMISLSGSGILQGEGTAALVFTF